MLLPRTCGAYPGSIFRRTLAGVPRPASSSLDFSHAGMAAISQKHVWIRTGGVYNFYRPRADERGRFLPRPKLADRETLSVLAFLDHCQPLAAGDDLKAILRFLHAQRGPEGHKYIELRPIVDGGMFGQRSDFGAGEPFSLHTIDLRLELETIYRGFHDSCVRRKIKRAEREKLTLETGNSKELLDKFRCLLLLTRRRHKLPPQPAAWFNNLARCLGNKLSIHVLSKDGVPAASILTLSYKNSLMYKYGCSDAQLHNLGGMPLLFWKTIQLGKQAGMEYFDLGRSTPDDPGLVAFKGHLGAVASKLTYYRDPAPRPKQESSQPKLQWARQAMACLPEPVLVGAGNLLYRHMG